MRGQICFGVSQAFRFLHCGVFDCYFLRLCDFGVGDCSWIGLVRQAKEANFARKVGSGNERSRVSPQCFVSRLDFCKKSTFCFLFRYLDLSHEMRTPLTSILLATGELCEADTEQRETLHRIIKMAAEALLALINDQLDMGQARVNLKKREIIFCYRLGPESSRCTQAGLICRPWLREKKKKKKKSGFFVLSFSKTRLMRLC
jgi:hypothetical protein